MTEYDRIDPTRLVRILTPIAGQQDKCTVGTGYLISADLVLTARHVVDLAFNSKDASRCPDRPLSVEFPHSHQPTAKGDRDGPSLTLSVAPGTGIVLPQGAQVDLALIQLEKDSQLQRRVKTIKIATDKKSVCRTGVEASTRGFPVQAEGICGMKSFALNGTFSAWASGDEVFQFQANAALPSYSGLSGAPLVDAQGALIGVIVREMLDTVQVREDGTWTEFSKDQYVTRQTRFSRQVATKPGNGEYLSAVPIFTAFEDEGLAAVLTPGLDAGARQAAANRLGAALDEFDRANDDDSDAGNKIRDKLELGNSRDDLDIKTLARMDAREVLDQVNSVVSGMGLEPTSVAPLLSQLLPLSGDFLRLARGRTVVEGEPVVTNLGYPSPIECLRASLEERATHFRADGLDGLIVGVRGIEGDTPVGFDGDGGQSIRDTATILGKKLAPITPAEIAQHIRVAIGGPTSPELMAARLRVHPREADYKTNGGYYLVMTDDAPDGGDGEVVSARAEQIHQAFKRQLPVYLIRRNMRALDAWDSEFNGALYQYYGEDFSAQ